MLNFKQNEEAVSPVIGTILMVAITAHGRHHGDPRRGYRGVCVWDEREHGYDEDGCGYCQPKWR
ncbi:MULTISPECIES: archaellin/type IV pilin N-terminal domain-containing protein [unclassified Methanoculleus]|uniref:archaellin/type IV pilin N-terminal domain-containing protein n=1 Tax=unclassified Methanoculleus TaxID=2619537 RepID=UPI0039B72D06